MEPRELRNNIWRLRNSILDLREGLIDSGLSTLAERQLSRLSRTLSFYYLLQETRVLTTIAGPQGVGKSTMVNRLLGLPLEAQLPVGEGSVEHTPIFLYPREAAILHGIPPTSKTIARLYFEPGKTDIPSYEFEDFTDYEEARKVARSYGSRNLCLMWYVSECVMLDQIWPIAVLPGLEIDAKWTDCIEQVIDITDLILYTVDFKRKAQATSQILDEWVKRAGREPLVVLTKADLMSQVEIEQLGQSVPDLDCLLGIWPDSPERTGEAYAKLRNEIGHRVVNLPPEPRLSTLRDIIELLEAEVVDIRKELARAAIGRKSDYDELITQMMDTISEEWDALLKPHLRASMDKLVNEAASEAREEASSYAISETSGFFKKIGLFINGGPSLSVVRGIEREVKRQFQEKFSTSGETLSDSLQLLALPQPRDGEKTIVEQQEVMGSTIAWALSRNFDRETMKKSELDSLQVLLNAKGLEEGMTKNALTAVKDYKDLTAALSSLIKDKPGSKSASAVPVASAAGGGTAVALEAVGSGFAGATATAIASIAGVAVAVIGIASLTISISRATRQAQFDLDGYGAKVVEALGKGIKEEFGYVLDRFWIAYKYQMRHYLQKLLGEDSDALLFALQSAKSAEITAKDVRKNLK
jgi:GTPase SAR1 family protein